MSNYKNQGFPVGNFTPAGFNDNNQNRQHVPSNIFPYNGGMVGNPFGRYNPVTTNQLNNMKNNPNMSNFDQSYKITEQIIEPIDYKNYGTTLHNNIGASVLDEHITEYRINIDSLDRDIKLYPNPFQFKVTFKPSGNGTVRTEVIKNGKLKAINDYFTGQPKPHISRNFRNVKYVKLDNIVLPQHTNISYDDEYKFNSDYNLMDDRFISLSIKELECNRIYDTSDDGLRINPDTNDFFTPPKIFGIIFPDKRLGKNFFTGTPYYSTKIYDSANLGNLDKLSIQFFDSCGLPLKINGLLNFSDLIKADDQNCPIPISDLRHPLNKKHQLHLSFVVGVVESSVNNVTKFEY